MSGIQVLRYSRGEAAAASDDLVAPRTRRGPVVWLLLAVVNVAIVAGIAAIVLLDLGIAGNPWYRIVGITGGSMEPAISRGDLIVIAPAPPAVEPGMVLLMTVGSEVITHRVAAVNTDGSFVTRGDANRVTDAWSGRQIRVNGLYVATIPLLGHILPIKSGSDASFADRASATMNVTVGPWTTGVAAAPTQEPPANAAGWNSTDVVVTWNWSDTGAGIDPATCATSSTSSGEGALALTASCTDKAGVTGTASYAVNVDKTPPAVTIDGHPNDTGGSTTAAFTFEADDTGGSGLDALSCTLDAGPTTPCDTPMSQRYPGLADGPHTFTVTATDRAGNPGPASFTWSVDAVGPVIAPHDPVAAEATGPTGALVTYTAPTTSDAVDAPGVATCVPAMGSLFALGPTTVACDATDAAGNTASQTTFVITVVDTTGPEFSALADQEIPATGPSGAIATWTTPTASDAVDGTDPVHCLPASGSTFPVGSTTVRCTSTDAASNTATHTFTVTVVANAPTAAPVIELHGDVAAEATSPEGAQVTYDPPTTSDEHDGSGVATCGPASGSLFPLGSTTILCDAVDADGNPAAQTQFTVTVRDTTPPAFAAPADQEIPATGLAGAVSTWTTPTATDAVDGTDPVHCLPASGSTFPVGSTTVTCTSTDAASNTMTHTFSVTVVSNAPTAAPTQAPAANGNGWNNADVVVTWHWSSAESMIDAAQCTASSTSSGEGTLTLTATCANVAGNTGTATYAVKVDKTKPAVAITGQPASPSSAGSASFTFSATDAGSGIDTVSCKLDAGPAAPCDTATSHGYTGLDAGSHTFTVIATDLAGNDSQATFTWCIKTAGPSVTVDHEVDGSNGWNRTSPVALVITVTPATAPATGPPVCTDNGQQLTVTDTASPYAATVTGDGTHEIRCKVTDTAGVSATGTGAVEIDTTPPKVTVPADIAVGSLDKDGLAVSYAATFGDATSGLAKKGCTPASASTFPIGITTVTCSATDKAGNSQSRSFTITVKIQTAVEARQAILVSLQDELACTASKNLRNRLSDAVGHVRDSLAASLWVATGRFADGNHLDPVSGETVFDADRAAVEALTGIKKPSSAVKAAIADLASADELLAQTAIDDAIAANADPRLISAAQEEMTAAEGDAAKGHFGLAIDHRKSAWRDVTALPAS